MEKGEYGQHTLEDNYLEEKEGKPREKRLREQNVERGGSAELEAARVLWGGPDPGGARETDPTGAGRNLHLRPGERGAKAEVLPDPNQRWSPAFGRVMS